jgi:hypothetical protein
MPQKNSNLAIVKRDSQTHSISEALREHSISNEISK